MSAWRAARLAAVLAEIQRRKQDGSSVQAFDPTSLLTEPQRERYRGIQKSRATAIPAGRRSGKTDLAAKLLHATATARPRTQSIYGTTSIRRAIDLLWQPLVDLNKDRRLGGTPNWGTHTITFPNGATVKLTGFENKKQANEQARGKPKVALWFIDECQDFDGELLKYLYEDCIKPSFADVGGRVVFGGTGSTPRGYWHELAHTMAGILRFPEWTAHSNPHLEVSAEELIAEACRDQGVDVTAPSIQKEWYGRFVVDSQSQIFNYLAERNGFDRGEWDPKTKRWTGLPPGKWSYVIGADFGSIHAAAWVVWAFCETDPHLYLVDADEQACLSSSAQAAFVQAAIDRYSDGLVGAFGDPGGGGKGVIMDLRQVHGLLVHEAEKMGKPAACVTLRDGIRTGKVKIATALGFLITKLGIPEWDPEAIGDVVRGHFPDVVDAGLYGHRHAAKLHVYVPPVPQPTGHEAEIAKALQRQEEEAAWRRKIGA